MPHNSLQRQAKHSRQALLWGGGAFVLLQIALMVGIETKWRIFRDPEFYARLGAFENRSQPPRRVLFLGTSRMEWGVQRAVLEPQLTTALGEPVEVMNFGTGGGEVFRCLLNWERLQREGIRPDLVLVEILPASLDANRGPDTDERRLPVDLLDHADVTLLREFAPDRAYIREQHLLSQLVPIHVHHRKMLRVLLPRLDGQNALRSMKSYRGDFRVTVSAERRKSLMEEMREGYEPTLKQFRVSKQTMDLLEELLRRISGSGCRVALIWMPEGPEFRSWYSESTHQSLTTNLNNTCRRLRIPFLNLQNWYTTEHPFNDSHHFTAEGADHFSDRLGREVILPLLRRPNSR